jgi:cytochrome c-type biogenesis protein CcmF
MGTEITLGKEYFMQVTPPLFLAMYLLMGVAPLSAWSATTLARLGNALFVPALLTVVTVFGIAFTSPSTPVSLIGYGAAFLAGYVALWETYRGATARRAIRKESWLQSIQALFRRSPQRYGGYLVHLGITIIGIGVIGSTLFQLETRQTLRQGETIQINSDYALRFDSMERGLAADGREIDTASLSLLQNGTLVSTITPRIDNFPGQSMTIAGAYSTLEKDVYVLLTGADETGSVATFKIYINPLVNLVWWGGVILIIGTLLAAWPRELVGERSRQSSPSAAKAAA